jgi:uncharacterized membrane protein
MRILLCALLLVLAAPVQAASFDVKGVEWGDVLNVRKGPSAKAALIGAIPYDGQGIDVSGKPAKGWVKVQYRGMSGFVLAKYLAPSKGEGPLPAKLSCHGTEPFWTIEISPQGVSYQLMTEPKEKISVGPFMAAANRTNGWMATGNKTAIQISREHACSNGMSDEAFPYSIMATTPGGDGVMSGCCK